jgi:hypothetical protein
MSKARNARLVGQTVIHKDLGRCIVTGTVPGSFTKCEIRCIQRGRGWNEAKQRYEKYTLPADKLGIFYSITRRDEYGHEDVAHVDDLKPVDS